MKGQSALLSSPCAITEAQRDPLTHPTRTHMCRDHPLCQGSGISADGSDKHAHSILSPGGDHAAPRRAKRRAKHPSKQSRIPAPAVARSVPEIPGRAGSSPRDPLPALPTPHPSISGRGSGTPAQGYKALFPGYRAPLRVRGPAPAPSPPRPSTAQGPHAVTAALLRCSTASPQPPSQQQEGRVKDKLARCNPFVFTPLPSPASRHLPCLWGPPRVPKPRDRVTARLGRDVATRWFKGSANPK